MARPKGKNPGPGCLHLPMERWTELHAVVTPIIRRIYPVTRSHFSISLFPRLISIYHASINSMVLSKLYKFRDRLPVSLWSLVCDAKRDQGDTSNRFG